MRKQIVNAESGVPLVKGDEITIKVTVNSTCEDKVNVSCKTPKGTICGMQYVGAAYCVDDVIPGYVVEERLEVGDTFVFCGQNVTVQSTQGEYVKFDTEDTIDVMITQSSALTLYRKTNPEMKVDIIEE